MPYMTEAAVLSRDARNRAVRTFVQGLALDVLVAVALLVLDALGRGEVEWRLLLLSLGRTVAQTAAAYIMRKVVDPSRFPTPLPPEQAGDPDADSEPPK